MSQEPGNFVFDQQSERGGTPQQTPSKTEQTTDLEGIRKVAQQHLRLMVYWRDISELRLTSIINTVTILLMASESAEAFDSVRAFFVELHHELSRNPRRCEEDGF
jgi:hypothetical protein